MNQQTVQRKLMNYRCGGCDQAKQRDQLHVKRVQFKNMGEQGRVIKTRVIVWLCAPCMTTDPDFSIPSTPGKPRQNGLKS